jgi:hypothetical protein
MNFQAELNNGGMHQHLLNSSGDTPDLAGYCPLDIAGQSITRTVDEGIANFRQP